MPALPNSYPDTARRDWLVDEVATLPDDGNRYEVVDGELLVTPAPSLRHQVAIRELVALLLPYVKRADLELFFAPTAVRWGPRSEIQPDVLVLPRLADRSGAYISGLHRLLLAVEVISPSSTRADREVKRVAFQREGVADYWIVDVAARCIERWRPSDSAPEVLVDALAWTPRPPLAPLIIDLRAFFALVHDE